MQELPFIGYFAMLDQIKALQVENVDLTRKLIAEREATLRTVTDLVAQRNQAQQEVVRLRGLMGDIERRAIRLRQWGIAYIASHLLPNENPVLVDEPPFPLSVNAAFGQEEAR